MSGHTGMCRLSTTPPGRNGAFGDRPAATRHRGLLRSTRGWRRPTTRSTPQGERPHTPEPSTNPPGHPRPRTPPPPDRGLSGADPQPVSGHTWMCRLSTTPPGRNGAIGDRPAATSCHTANELTATRQHQPPHHPDTAGATPPATHPTAGEPNPQAWVEAGPRSTLRVDRPGATAPGPGPPPPTTTQHNNPTQPLPRATPSHPRTTAANPGSPRGAWVFLRAARGRGCGGCGSGARRACICVMYIYISEDVGEELSGGC